MANFITTTRLVGKKPESALMSFQKGIQQTCVALPLLHKHLIKQFPEDRVSIPTYRLNQDIVERFFSIFRAARNTNPDTVEATRRLKSIVFGREFEVILKGSKTNVQPESQQGGCRSLTAQV